MRIGSLFSGAGGLDLAVQEVFGGEVVWHAEIDKAASKVLAYRFPGVPNLGDISAVDWADVPAVDVLCGGFPCQDVSAAGKRAGIKAGTRSGLWSVFADAIDALRPQWVVIENVRGLLSATAHRTVDDADSDVEPAPGVMGDGAGRPVLRAAGAVLGDLADLGYDAQWTTVAAANVGAPHRRERVFILAYAEGARRSVWDTENVGAPYREVNAFADDCESATDAAGKRQQGSERPDYSTTKARRAATDGVALLPTPAAGNFNDGEDPETWMARRDAVRDRLGNGNGMGMPLSIAVQLLPTPTTQDGANNGRPSQFQRNSLPLNAEVMLLPTPRSSDCFGAGQHGDGGMDLRTTVVENASKWGKYAPAIARWESVVGPAPAPTEPNKNGNPRLSAAFSEWLMGWPQGWVTAIGISRNDQLRIIGNGVCPQQAIAALRFLLAVAINSEVTA